MVGVAKYKPILKRTLTILILAGLFGFIWPQRSAQAVISDCSASVNPHTVTPSTDAQFYFTITNNDLTRDVRWIKITRPSENFSITGDPDIVSWNAYRGGDAVILAAGNLSSGESLVVNFQVSTENVQAASANWTVMTADNYDGSDATNPTTCTGSLGTAISGSAPDNQEPEIVNVRLSGLSDTSVKTLWDTDEPASSEVEYGTTDQYGSTKTTSGLKTTHQVALTGLAPDTIYHYRVKSADAAGNTAYSSDNTFLTAEKSTTITKTVTVPVTNPSDKIAPSIKLSTKIVQGQVFDKAPKIEGQAKDETQLAAIEYSTDGGQNWLPVDSPENVSGKEVNFDFTPSNLDDGNYTLLARAIDNGANATETKPIKIVIDRLPPLVGGNLIALGPQVLQPNKDGLILTTAGVEQKITLSAVGGATSIEVEAKGLKDKNKIQSFSLTKSLDNGLWSGILSFSEPGTYTLTANSIDGAGNKTSRQLNTVSVQVPTQVLEEGNNDPVYAEATVYYQISESDEWLVWDGPAYGQDNPQKADNKGQFELLLPAGKYYLRLSAEGYKDATTNIFETNAPTPISATLHMKKGGGFKLGPISIPWFDFSNEKIDINPSAQSAESTNGTLANKSVPDFDLTDTASNQINAGKLFGRPTDLVITSTWVPASAEQLPALAELQKNKNVNIVAAALQEDAAKLQAYNSISGYTLNWLADPDSTLSAPFAVQSLPTHYFIDRKGIIQEVIYGVLSKDEITQNLSSL